MLLLLLVFSRLDDFSWREIVRACLWWYFFWSFHWHDIFFECINAFFERAINNWSTKCPWKTHYAVNEFIYGLFSRLIATQKPLVCLLEGMCTAHCIKQKCIKVKNSSLSILLCFSLTTHIYLHLFRSSININ